MNQQQRDLAGSSLFPAGCSDQRDLGKPRRSQVVLRSDGRLSAREKLLTIVLSIVLSLGLSAAQAPTAYTNPDNYFDFSNIQSSSTANFVVDQVTKNPMNSFTFEAPRLSACPNTGSQTGLIQPTIGPDGLIFDKEKQAVRLQYADNINLGPRWMIGLWVKAFAGVPPSRNETLITQARYDNRNETPHQFSIGVMTNPTATSKTGLRFSAFLYNTTTGKYQYVEFFYQGGKLDIQDSWHLIVVGIDSLTVPTKTTILYKVKSKLITGTASFNNEYGTADLGDLIWQQRAQDKQDIYLGAFCDLFNPNKLYGNPFRGTISRLYIWQNVADTGIWADSFLDKFFFRSTGAIACNNGVISGSNPMILPCKYCIVGNNPPTSLSAATTLSCLSEDKTLSQMFIAYWDFNEPKTQQFIDDQTGNGYVLYKGTPQDSEPNEPFRIWGQGYLFEMNMFAMANIPLYLHSYPQFTLDIWVRRESPPPASSVNTNAFAFLIDKTVSGTYQLDFGVQVSDVNQKVFVTFNNKVGSSPAYTTILKDNTWNFFAVSVYRYTVGASKFCRIRYQVNLESQAVTNCPVGYSDFQVTNQNTMQLIAYRSYIFNRIRLWQHAMSSDEIPTIVVNATAIPTSKKQGQPPCSISPEDGKCLTMCNQNQFENATTEACDSCHYFCGGCKGAGKDNCVYCTRSTSVNVFYSQQYGNCSCSSGMYYNSTTDKCEVCPTACKECFGPTNLECLTCNTGTIFYPPTYCVEKCTDPIVIGDGKYGYFKKTEVIAGAGNFDMCVKCHPYCTACYDSENGNCTDCQDGFFLQGSSCIDNCPYFQYPDMKAKKCQDCFDKDVSFCLKCSGPQQNKCSKCWMTDVTLNNGTVVTPAIVQKKYLQTGWCKNQCDPGFYPDTELVCQPCHQACATCTTPRNTTCGSCTSGYYLEWLGFSCGFGCDPGKYGDGMTNMCLLCHYSCKTCSGAGPDQCTVCADGYYRRKSLCVAKCEEGEFIVDGQCMSCDKKCLTCFGPKDDQCYTCAENTVTGLGYYYFNFKCVSDCPSGYYADNFEKVCTPCKTVCSSCTSWDFCTGCIDGPYQLNNGECTFFQCMDNQYRAVKPTLACYDCDPVCLTCQGMSKFDCLTCRPSDKFQDNTCITCKEQPGMTNSADPNFSGCVEICGDGFNFGMYECDDGNLANGDGCDSKCRVEPGWACTGGSILMPDSCSDVQSPTPKISLINKQNQIYISFDEEVVITEDLYTGDPKFVISVVGNQPSYKYDWTLQAYLKQGDHIQNFVISLKFYQSLRGNEKVTVVFLNGHTFQDSSGNGIVQVPLTGFLSAFEFRDPFWSIFLDGIADYIIISAIALAFVNIILAQYYSVSTTSLWTTIFYIQMITLVPLMNVNWPNFVDTFFWKIGSTFNGEISAIPNVIFDKAIAPSGTKTLLEPPLSARYAAFGLEYSNFFYLTGRKLLLWGCLLGIYPVIWYLKRNYADKHKFCKLWEKIEQRYRYVFFLRGITLAYMTMVLAATLNIYKMEFVNMQTTASCFISVAFLIGMIYLPIHIMNILQRNYDKLNHPKFLAQFNTVISELDLSHPSKYMYYAVFFIRRIIYAFMLVLFTESPVIAVACHGATSMFVILYVLIGKPFKKRVTAVLTIIGELLVTALHGIGLGIRDPDQPDKVNQQFGFLIILVLALLMAIGFICILVQVSQDLVAECKQRKAQDQDLQAKEDADQKYKRWKKRRQLVKRETALRDKQKLLDQHEDLVNQYRRQQEEEEERRAREEEERERLEQEAAERAEAEEYGGEGGNNPYGNEYGQEYGNEFSKYGDSSAYGMIKGADAIYGYDNQQVMYAQQSFQGQAKGRAGGPPQPFQFKAEVGNDQYYQETEERVAPAGRNQFSRNTNMAGDMRLNKDSGEGAGSNENLQAHLQEVVNDFYGDEAGEGYGEENYYGEEVKQEEEPPKKDEKAASKSEIPPVASAQVNQFNPPEEQAAEEPAEGEEGAEQHWY